MNTRAAPRWNEFMAYCRELGNGRKVGRSALRRSWSALRDLFQREVLPHLTPDEIERLLGKRIDDLDPEENDLKALTAHAVGRGLVQPEQLRDALRTDIDSSPLYFLANSSGKTFGETVAPALVRFWMMEDGDRWVKRPASDLFDIEWAAHGTAGSLRIELKASSEFPGFRFQQIRDPRVGGKGLDYDALLCLGVTAGTIDFWLIGAADVGLLIDRAIIVPQHGGHKIGLASNTYWLVTTAAVRAQLESYAVMPDALRRRALALGTRHSTAPHQA